jgi:endonuclease/exonuclease/phosphatase (EEP) superfamily protein YafD
MPVFTGAEMNRSRANYSATHAMDSQTASMTVRTASMSVGNYANYSAIHAENSAVRENYSEQRTNYSATDAENFVIYAEHPSGSSTLSSQRRIELRKDRNIVTFG